MVCGLGADDRDSDRVEVEYSQFTRDECVMLDEIQEASIAEDELQSDPWRMEVDEEDEDNESWIEPIWEEEDISMDERRHQNGGYDMEDEEGWYRESEIAQDLYWLNKERVYPVYEVMPYRRCRGEHFGRGYLCRCWLTKLRLYRGANEARCPANSRVWGKRQTCWSTVYRDRRGTLAYISFTIRRGGYAERRA